MEILTVNSSYARHALKRRLTAELILDYKCGICGNTGIWNNVKLSLQLDHVNGIYNDNRIENLRFLCPNCHSQTDSYAGKNIIGKSNSNSAKQDYRFTKRKKDEEKWLDIKNNSLIDFNSRGWVKKVAELLNISPQKVNRWLMRVDAAFYLEKYRGE